MLARLIDRIANGFGTKTAIVVALCWSLLPVIPALAGYQVLVLYVSAGIVQLVALPLLSYQAREASRHAQATHARLDAVDASHADIHNKLDALHAHFREKP